MDPMLYDTLRQKIQSVSTEATRIHLGPEITPERTKRSILRIVGDLHVPVTVRRVLEGVIFWRSHKEDTQQAQEIAGRLEARQPRGKTAPQRPRRKRNVPRRSVHAPRWPTELSRR
jgi:hypothetical protein